MAMMAIPVRCQWRDGSVSDTEVPAVEDPAHWTRHEAREAAWAIQRALHATVVFALRLVEVSPMQIWRIEVVASTGMATTGGLPLPSAALVWLQEAAFELPGTALH
jgi:hypothetical protein